MVFLSPLFTGVANTAGALAGERQTGVPCLRCLGYPYVPHSGYARWGVAPFRGV